MANRKRLLCVAAGLLMATAVFAVDYAKEMHKAFDSTFRQDFSKYQTFGLPVSNFGAGTIYPKEANGSKFDVTTGGIYGNPNTWWVDSVTPAQSAELLKTLLPSGKTGKVALKLDKNKKFGLSVVFPALYQLLSADGKIDYSKKITVSISATNAENHRLDWSALADDLDKNLIKPFVKRHLSAKDCVITTGDIVLYDYTATLNVDKSLDAAANAKLTAAWKAFGKDTSASFTYSSGEKGDFSVTATDPVVAAVFVGEPPDQLSLAIQPTDVKQVLIPQEVLTTISEAIRKGATVPAPK